MPSTLVHGVRVLYHDLGSGEPALLFLAEGRGELLELAGQCAAHRRVLLPTGGTLAHAAAVIARSSARLVVPVVGAGSRVAVYELALQLGPQIPGVVLWDAAPVGVAPVPTLHLPDPTHRAAPADAIVRFTAALAAAAGLRVA